MEYVLKQVAKQAEIPVNHLLNEINVQRIFFLSYKVNISILLSSFSFLFAKLSCEMPTGSGTAWGLILLTNTLCELGATAGPSSLLFSWNTSLLKNANSSELWPTCIPYSRQLPWSAESESGLSEPPDSQCDPIPTAKSFGSTFLKKKNNCVL